ncbi:acyl-CoA dehydrogenase family protein [Pseudohalioglobus lutimaris]|uniref:Acyl-CoA dehydrogenase n=1 Tax=Pseudohalioglobus lutimaris TaxID=1737061 RepID=A0A2N5X7G5_9GAMM|nr:acyl-CoA dehydrogenase family protein [Pseudohalioglobus lutimaris]PLW70425.1 acyl-CoA dehydrogenase [Pseudohalioglobus lutimaris]
MEFAFTEEQEMIRDTAAAFLAEVSTSEAIRQAMATERGYDAELWQRICGEMYWQAIHVPEAYGGMGLGYVEVVAMMEQMGRYLLCSPFFSTVCLASNALLVLGNEEQKSQWLGKLCTEGLTATVAFNGGVNRWDAQCVTATYRRDGDAFLLNGDYRYVIDGHTSDLIIVAAREEGTSGEQGVSLFLVPADTEGVSSSWLPTMDQARKQASLQLVDVALSAGALMGEAGNGWPALATVIDLASVALAAEQVGGCQQLLDMTVDYTTERVQFNRPIASFQAVKHKAADMMLQTEVARSGVYYAACVAQEALAGGELASELPEAASVAKSYCSDAYFAIAGDALQLFGGVGFTWEYDVHLYFKRAKSSEHLLGNGAAHRERLATLLLDKEDVA